MLFIGVFILLGCSFFAWREYKLYLGREALEISELIAFLKHTRERMSCYLEPMSVWITDYSTPELERLGFLSALRRGEGVAPAFDGCSSQMCVSSEVGGIFTQAFSDTADGYLDSELAALDDAVDKLSLVEKRSLDDYKNKIHASGAMLAAIAIGVVILVI